jgi:hypothetical protein
MNFRGKATSELSPFRFDRWQRRNTGFPARYMLARLDGENGSDFLRLTAGYCCFNL